MRHPHYFKIAIALTLSAGAWGLYWLPQRVFEDGGLTGGWGSISQTLIAFILLLPITVWRLIKGKSSGLELPLTGLLLGGGYYFYAICFLLTDVVRALLLFYMVPVWATVFEILFLKRKHGWQRAISLILAIGGLWVVFAENKIIPLPQSLGDWVALAGGVIFAGGMTRLELIKTDGIFPIVMSFFFYGTLFGIVSGLALSDGLGPIPSIDSFISMSIYITAFSLFFYIPTIIIILWAPTQIGSGICSILFLSEVLVGAISSSILTDEPFGWRQITGCSLVIIGAILAVVLTPKEKKI